jgi:nucleoside-diphosphate-sugar epimerase/glyoxylase-like metal-dependent hydrolase (beta-lactamase superfamily II)
MIALMVGSESETSVRPQVVVTGANGFLGRYVTRELLAHGYHVIGMARSAAALRETNPPEVEPLITTLADLGSADLPRSGLSHEAVLNNGPFDGDHARSGSSRGDTPRAGLPKVDAIIHCAGLSSPWGHEAEFEEANVAGTRNVLKFAQRNNISRIVFVSSPSVYSARRDRLNIRESEFDPNNHLNHYIASKIRAEELLQQAHVQGDLPELVIIRPRGLIGVGDTSVIPRLLRVNDRLGIPLFRGGSNVVDLTSVENVALALRLAVSTPHSNGRVFNITNGDPRPLKELLDLLMDQLGKTGRYWNANAKALYTVAGALESVFSRLPGNPEPPVTVYTVSTIAHSQTLDISAARADLSYEPRVSIEESIAAFAQDLLRKPEPVDAPQSGPIPNDHRLKYFACGHTHHTPSQMFSGGAKERRTFPSGVFLYEHPGGQRVLFDTGYAPHPGRGARAVGSGGARGERTLSLAGFKGWAYAKLLPPVVTREQVIDQQLRAVGIAPESISHVVLSHGHPDHIGGVQFFPHATFVVSAGLARKLRASRVKDGVFSELLPDWFESRLQIVDDTALSSTTVGPLRGYDLFGDGTYLITPLPGHALGHVGGFVEGKILLAGDAAWGSDLAGRCADMKPVPKFIQDDAKTYIRTAQGLDELSRSGDITVLYSHDSYLPQFDGSSSGGSVGWL